jgi:hypothetical protein
MSRTKRPCLGYLALLVVCLPVSGFAADYGGGAGTPQDPFLIYTPADFSMIGDNPADWDKHFKLMSDIDLTGYDEANLHLIGRWVTWGSPTNLGFTGVFDGNGRTISNFRYKDAHLDYVGLFEYVWMPGLVKNLTLRRATVIGNGMGTGSLVGYVEKGSVAGCTAVQVEVSGNLDVGGLVGRLDGSVGKCSTRGRVAGNSYVGGLIGQVGEGVVNQSYSKARVVGNENAGGLTGGTTGETAVVDSCYATGAVEGGSFVGGLVGQIGQGRIFKCYSAGEVTGDQQAGGLVGYHRALGQVMACRWDTQTSRQTTSSGGTGATTSEMKSIDTFVSAGWDFIATWTICEGVNYPILLWQIPPGDLRCPDGVTASDFAWFAQQWRHDNCSAANWDCDGADLDQSGVVEYRDLLILAENWLAGAD